MIFYIQLYDLYTTLQKPLSLWETSYTALRYVEYIISVLLTKAKLFLMF
jgi:hypothetical protein